MQDAVVAFIDAHRGKKQWYVVPRALYWNEQNIGELQKVLQWMEDRRYIRVGDIPAYQPELGEKRLGPDDVVLREWDRVLQVEIYDRMVEEGIIAPTARDQSINDKLANLRNHFNLLKKLGLGYRNKEGKLFISDVGKEFLKAQSNQVGDIIERQLIRLQFHNPSLDPGTLESYRQFRLFPYLCILRVLNELPDKSLTTEEFFLFVACAETEDQLDEIQDLLMYYKGLDRDDQLKVVRYAEPTVPMKANASVHLQLFGVTPTLAFDEAKLSVANPTRARYLLDYYSPKLKYVEYERFEDWSSYIGSTDERIELRDIVKYYTEIGRDKAARRVVQEARFELDVEEEAKSLQELLEQLFSEQVLEHALEKQPSLLEKGLKLVRKGRQFATDVGPIDLLGSDSDDRFVVIELKKGLAEDKVVGQTLRYMGWVREYLSPTRLVRGIIVSREVTDKLKMAIAGMQHSPPIVQLRQFTLDVGGEIKEVESIHIAR